MMPVKPLLTARHFSERFAIIANHEISQSIGRWASLRVTTSRQVALTIEDLGRQISTKIRCFSSPNGLYYGSKRAPIVLEGFRTVHDVDTASAAQNFIEGTVIDVLKPAPTSDVVHEHHTEIRLTLENIGDKFFQARTVLDL